MKHDALGAHARDELGIPATGTARPIQAAFTSAATFSADAALPLSMVLIPPLTDLILPVSLASLVFLALVGQLGRPYRRFKSYQRRISRYLLESIGNGPDCGRRLLFRRGVAGNISARKAGYKRYTGI